jgi:hypothetical protein
MKTACYSLSVLAEHSRVSGAPVVGTVRPGPDAFGDWNASSARASVGGGGVIDP